ncbi:uncharacterized protein LOC131842631 [Achroia grisella]|uniref:uncharacterized protein LOC131842631 n=1 Tax=Achroia grisella TaxID=688607 RepID=UPI0027D318E0|nr:uncharacterized protein LOC131842631 [Achroia grisella]
MERAIKERKLLRRLFTINAKKLDDALENREIKEAEIYYDNLCEKQTALNEIDNKICSLWLDEDNRNEAEFEADIDTTEEYKNRWYALKRKSAEIIRADRQMSTLHETESSASNGTVKNAKNERRYRLPILELPRYNGDVKKWILFWGQYKKIHNDENIDNEDKFQYLLQCMEPGSSARELVESFPPSGDNYFKALEHLKQRFARDELIIEHYIRELLDLILRQAKGMAKNSLRNLYDKLMTQILGLETLGVTQDKYAAILYPMVESTLPEEVLRAWNRSQMRLEKIELAQLLIFLQREVESEERISQACSNLHRGVNDSIIPSTACFTVSEKNGKNKPENREKYVSNTFSDNKPCCIWCDKNSHTSSECMKAQRMSLEERRTHLKEKNCCYICMKKGHSAAKCRAYPKCLICSRRHFTLMCNNLQNSLQQPRSTSMTSSSSENNTGTTSSSDRGVVLSQTSGLLSKCQTVLLPTLKVNIVFDNNIVSVRTLLDSGAQRSFIKKDIIENLKLKPSSTEVVKHNLFGGITSKESCRSLYNLNISSIDCSYSLQIEALEEKVICNYLPKINDYEISNKLRRQGIVINDNDNVTDIGLLIGADMIGTLLTGRVVQITDKLVALETKLGWTVQGPIQATSCFSVINSNIINVCHCTFDIADLWKLETMGISDPEVVKKRNETDLEILEYFNSTVRLNNYDRYEVNLPWKDGGYKMQLVTNYEIALKRLKSTTTKITQLGILKEYDEVFKEWLHSGIIEKVNNPNSNQGHYLPHHAVIKESSLTTKIRPVFNASATQKGSISLNNCLEKGNNLIELIPPLLIKFRKNAIGITADIKKAFLQISLKPDDREYLKFLWWKDVNKTDGDMVTYRHCRVVFGVTCSPFLLSATILYHLNKYDNHTANVLKSAFYVDNCVVSVDSKKEMETFISESKLIMLKGGFELRCWVTGPHMVDKNVETISVLGLMWDPKRDEIFCKIPQFNSEYKVTMRTLLSCTHSIFDPLGFFCAATLLPRLLIQKCWQLKLNWDDEVPDSIEKPAKEWMNQIGILQDCHLPRRLSDTSLKNSNKSLHIFSDASQLAYSACIFLRSEFNGIVSVKLVLAKNRITPPKPTLTIPRLELLSALMASRLAVQVKKAMELESCKEYYWSDSSIVLSWFTKSDLNVYVHNRVKEIKEKTNVNNWHHIPGNFNPADLPSRGCNPQSLINSKWWNGPDWLRKPESEWPFSAINPDINEVNKEIIKRCLLVKKHENFTENLTYFSDFNKIVRMIGWCYRFVNNSGKKNNKQHGNLIAEEYEYAEMKLLHLIQKETFNEEYIKRLKLETFRDGENIVRVKTRVTLSDNTNNFIRPILLPGKNILIERLVRLKHKETLHAGSQTLINCVREQYWIIGIRRLVKSIIRHCVACRRHNSRPYTVHSAPLPADRVRCGAAFEATGIDMAGPLYLKSGDKCWVVLFTCATYRAIHLELCTSLSTEDFLLSLRRFLARRGRVRTIYSDNGTNFRGAHSLLNKIDWAEISKKSSIQKLQWKFIPPNAPWWGGFWERLIKMLKELLRRMLGKAALHYTELLTILTECEAILNNRPLTYITENTENLMPLTPSMFINCLSYDVSDLDEVNTESLNNRLKYIQKLKNDFKVRFRNEYLAILAQKTQNNRIQKGLHVKVGDIVLIEINDTKRVNWPLAIVEELYPGVDGHERVARLKTTYGERIRPLQRLYPLEISTVDPIAKEAIAVLPKTTRSGRVIKIPQRLLV